MVGFLAVATFVRATCAACRGAAGSRADAVAEERDATRQMVPMIAALLVRTFTVILLEAVNGEVTRLLGQVQGCRPRQHATWVGGWCATGHG